ASVADLAGGTGPSRRAATAQAAGGDRTTRNQDGGGYPRSAGGGRAGPFATRGGKADRQKHGASTHRPARRGRFLTAQSTAQSSGFEKLWFKEIQFYQWLRWCRMQD